MNKAKKANIFLLAGAILFLAVSCNQQSVNQPVSQSANQQNQGQPTSSQPGVIPPPAGINQPIMPQGQTQTRQNPSGPDYFPGGQRAEDPIEIAVTQNVEGSNLNGGKITVAQGINALALLKMGHQVVTKTYSGIGEFVESIDGIKPDSTRFWAFYVNGKSSNVGASSYKLQSGDKIEWKLEKINNASL